MDTAGAFREESGKLGNTGRRGLFDIGDKVVYPHHGAGTVVSKERRIVLGQEREYLTIKILHNDMTVNVPSENAEKVGLRWVIDEQMVEVVVKTLTGVSKEMTEEQAAEWLDEVVARPAAKRPAKAKPKAAAATV